MKFLGFSKIWRRNSQNIFISKIFFFEKNYFQEISSQILENPKNFMISFFHPLSFTGKIFGPNFHFRFFPRMFSFSQSVSFFPKIKHFFSPKQNEISVQVQDEPKMFFHSFPAAEKATGLNRQTIREVLERGNKVYHRKADHKLFHISKEDPILIAKIEGEEFFSLEEIHTKLDFSPTRFLNQIKSGKFAKKIDWISDELFPGEKPTGEEIR